MKEEIEIKIIRSSKRNKSVSAKMVGNIMEVRAPKWISDEELRETIKELKGKFKKQKLAEDLNKDNKLWKVAERLNHKYFDGKLKFKSIEYVTNYSSMFGSCDIEEKEIRISHEVAAYPTWVRDYVIMHELAHLIEGYHNDRFWKLVNQYPLTERARGFLLAKGLGEEETPDKTYQS